MRTREDVVWAAGLFEGEGSIGSFQDGTPRVSLEMTDLDVVERFAWIMGFGTIDRREPRQPHHKTKWTWRCSNLEGVQALVAFLWPWLGARRRQRSREVLERANERPGGNRLKTRCPRGHTYDKVGWYRKRSGERAPRRECLRCCRRIARDAKRRRKQAA